MSSNLTRRSFAGGAAWFVLSGRRIFAQERAADLIQRVRAPRFRDREFPVTSFGADGGGRRLSTGALEKAIQACSAAGGGRVVVPPGVFLTGAVHLKSNVNLHLEDGATLLFSRDPKHYLPPVFTRWEGTECMNYSPFLYAFEQSEIGITGRGILDGNADCEHWWPWKGKTDCGWKKGTPSQDGARTSLMRMGDQDVPVKDRVFGEGHYLRPNFIQPYRCANILIEGVTIRNSPMWEIHPVLCRNVTVDSVHISTHGPNNDGCDPESSTDVLVRNCTFSTGDDCIAIKSGRNRDGRRLNVPCDNIIVEGCQMEDGHGGVSIGSEASGGVRNVLVNNCRMSSPNLERALRIKTNSYRGGAIENVRFQNVTVGQVANAAVEIDFTYEDGAGGPFPPVVRNIVVENVTCGKSEYAVFLRGFPDAKIRGVRLKNSVFDGSAKPSVIQNVEGLEIDRVTVNGEELQSAAPR